MAFLTGWAGNVMAGYYAEGGIYYQTLMTGYGYDAIADSAWVTGCESDFSGVANIPSSITVPYTFNVIIGYNEQGRPIFEEVTRQLTYPVVSVGGFSYQRNLTGVTFPASIKTIFSEAYANTGLTSIELPSTINSIGGGAFENCTALENVTVYCSPRVPLNSCPFYGCENIKRVEFHCKNIKPLLNGVRRSGGDFVLNECIIGNEVDTIETSSLSNLYIRNLYIHNRLQSINSWPTTPWGSNIYQTSPNNLYISDLATHINSGWSPDFDYWYYHLNPYSYEGQKPTLKSGHYTYINGSLLSDLIIPNIDSIPPQFFRANYGLTRVNTGNHVKVIGADAFSEEDNLTDVIIGNSVTCLKGRAFGGCQYLKNVTIGENVETIGSDLLWIDESDDTWVGPTSAFEGCWSIQSITWNAINCNALDGGVMIFYSWNSSSLHEIVFGNKVKYIPCNFVGPCTGLTSLSIPASVLSIGESAFSYCGNLDTLYWNAKNCKYVNFDLEPIQEGSPFSWGSLKHIYIGSEVESIGGSMFNVNYYDNGENKTVTCYATIPPIISAGCFSEHTYESAVLKVPRESLEAYRNAEGWKKFFKCSAIEDIPGGEDDKVRGDVDGDGKVTIGDVTALIDYLLSGDSTGIDLDNADCDQDGIVNIGDVITLIDYLLTGSW